MYVSLGIYTNYIGTINQGDSAELKAYLRINDQPVTQDQIQSVTFTVQRPSVSQQVVTSYVLPITTLPLQSVEDIASTGQVIVVDTIGVETLNYTGISGNSLTGVTGGTPGATIGSGSIATFVTSDVVNGITLSDGAGFYRWTDTAQVGEYTARCSFQLVTGELRSVMVNFTVIDPFNPPVPTDIDQVVDQVMLRLEDCFDSTEGGPWLRDRTMAHFDAAKIAAFIPEALLDINVQMPPTNFDIGYFTQSDGVGFNPNLPLLVKGTLCVTIRHLMRSYTEIFTPTGQGQLVWPDRTRYQQAWGQIYQIENADYIAALRLWKRTTLNLGHSALLTFSKAGRLYPYAGMSTRGIYRGYN
jgi:hypothetical protein